MNDEPNITNQDDPSGCFADSKDTTCSLDNNDDILTTDYVQLYSTSSDTDSSRDWASYTETESSSNSDNSDYIDDSDKVNWPHERKEQEEPVIGYEKLNVYQSDDEVANKSSRKSNNICYRHKRYLSM